jgi:hypothetical protein
MFYPYAMNGPGRLRSATAVARQKKAAALGLARQLARARRPGCSSAPNMTGTEAKRRGDHGGAHLGQQTARRAMVVAHDGSSGLE